ncbi:MAG: hypothetical protein LBQ82_05740 [Treponema sp.]|nr:hypothetical protein [Treponema sp.]
MAISLNAVYANKRFAYIHYAVLYKKPLLCYHIAMNSLTADAKKKLDNLYICM